MYNKGLITLQGLPEFELPISYKIKEVFANKVEPSLPEDFLARQMSSGGRDRFSMSTLGLAGGTGMEEWPLPRTHAQNQEQKQEQEQEQNQEQEQKKEQKQEQKQKEEQEQDQKEKWRRLMSKRNPGCIKQCLRTGKLRPSQCHFLC